MKITKILKFTISLIALIIGGLVEIIRDVLIRKVITPLITNCVIAVFYISLIASFVVVCFFGTIAELNSLEMWPLIIFATACISITVTMAHLERSEEKLEQKIENIIQSIFNLVLTPIDDLCEAVISLA